MKEYFIAIELVFKPFMRYQSLGKFTDEDFEASEYFENPLVFDETIEIEYQFNVCSHHIVDNEIVAFTPAELTVFEAEFTENELVQDNKKKVDALENGTFFFALHEFPLDAASRMFYLATQNQNNVVQIRAVDGRAYTLEVADIVDFIDQMWKTIQGLTQHTL